MRFQPVDPWIISKFLFFQDSVTDNWDGCHTRSFNLHSWPYHCLCEPYFSSRDIIIGSCGLVLSAPLTYGPAIPFMVQPISLSEGKKLNLLRRTDRTTSIRYNQGAIRAKKELHTYSFPVARTWILYKSWSEWVREIRSKLTCMHGCLPWMSSYG